MSRSETLSMASPAGLTNRPRLGLMSLFAVAVGVVVVQGTMVSVLQGAGIGGYGFMVAIILAALLALCYVFSFSELSLMLPGAGSVSVYTEAALGHFPAIVATLAGYPIVAMFALSAELLLVEFILGQLYPTLFGFPGIGLGLLALLVGLNLLGVDIFARVQSLLAFVMLTTLLLIGFSGVSGQGAMGSVVSVIELNPLGMGVFSLVALAIWAFVGLEFVCPLSPDCQNPRRHVPLAMILALVVLSLIYLLLVWAGLKFVPMVTLAGSELPHMELVLTLFGDNGMLLLAVAAITATCSTVNTVLATVPRMLAGMADSGQLPACFANRRANGTPWVSTLVQALMIAAPVMLLGHNPQIIILLLISAAAAWIVTYMIAHLDVLVLRRRYPELSRPFKTPWCPVPQILGVMGMGYVFFNNSPSPELTAQVYGNTALVLGMVSLFAVLWVRLKMKKGLFEATPLSQLPLER
ncbi:APC family permease [Zobellella maritima]|uniref:APC family permease n=1 Tax=Zobellella maritima TaxID=2059725 RepID=UPI0018E551B2|nr:APC family permease [Zobellella maritima]